MFEETEKKMLVDNAKLLMYQADAMSIQVDKVQSMLKMGMLQFRHAFIMEESILESKDVHSGQLVASKADTVFEDLLSCIRSSTLLLYHAGQYPRNAVVKSKSRDIFSEKDCLPAQDCVFVRLTERAIYIRTPMLWATNGRMLSNSIKCFAGQDREIVFRDEILHGIRDAPNFNACSFSVYSKKLIHFLYVYADDPASKTFCVDNDSHATKYVQDAVTALLPGGDSPLTCSIYSSAALSSIVPESTFITVTPLEDGPKSDNEIIQFWEEIMEKHPSPEG